MEYRLLQDNASGAVFVVREDGRARGPLRDNEFRDNDAPDATIRVDWASDQRFTLQRPDLWNNDDYTVLATDRDPLSAVTDQPQSLERDDKTDASR